MKLLRLAEFAVVGLVLFSMCGLPVWINTLVGYGAPGEQLAFTTVAWSLIVLTLFSGYSEVIK
jgi:hypothetical protein